MLRRYMVTAQDECGAYDPEPFVVFVDEGEAIGAGFAHHMETGNEVTVVDVEDELVVATWGSTCE